MNVTYMYLVRRISNESPPQRNAATSVNIPFFIGDSHSTSDYNFVYAAAATFEINPRKNKFFVLIQQRREQTHVHRAVSYAFVSWKKWRR